MATVTVAANNTRLNDSDSDTNWSNEQGGGPAPGAEAQNRYQGTAAVNRKVTSTSGRQGVQYNHGSGTDFTQRPTFQAVTAPTTSLTVAWPTHAIDDVAFLFVETAVGIGNDAPTLSTPAGFEKVAEALISGATGTRLTMFWARATSASMASPVIASGLDHNLSAMVTYRGCRTIGRPFTTPTVATDSTPSTASFADHTPLSQRPTTIVGAVTRGNDATGAWVGLITNLNLSSITERCDGGTADGDGGGLATFDAVRTGGGAIGVTSAATTQGTQNATIIFSLVGQPKPLWIAKCYVTDFAALNATWGAALGLGSSSANRYNYNVAGSGANSPAYSTYPPQGGYHIVAIDPGVTAWRETTDGTPNLASVSHFYFAIEMASGAAKNENMALDAIDVGTGLTLTRGDGGDADGTFASFVTADQDNSSNRWGYASNPGGNIIARGLWTIGETATATEFVDNTRDVSWPDGFHSAGSFGLIVNLGNASTAVTIGSTLRGQGTTTSEDTRPVFLVTGTAGALTFTGRLSNFLEAALTSGCALNGADIQIARLIQGGASITDTTIRTTAPANTATLRDPTFGVSSGLRNSTFRQGGGHAIEIITPGSYTLTNLTFTNYGADGSSTAAILNNSGGEVTLNVSGGTTPTVRNVGASTTIVTNSKTVNVTVTDVETGSPIESARVLVEAAAGGTLPVAASVTIAAVTTTATVSHASHGLVTGDKVVIRGAVNSDLYNGVKTITVLTSGTYTFTMGSSPPSPATGTITATAVILSGVTNASGVVSRSDFPFVSDQPVTGVVRKGSAAPFYRQGVVGGTITSAGLAVPVALIQT